MSEKGYLLDLLFILDCTESMGDYIESVKKNIVEICEVLGASGKLREDEGLQVGLIAYRDFPEEKNIFVTKPHDFTCDIDTMKGYLAPLKAFGGGDLPEAFSTALEYGFEEMTGWREGSMRAFVVITDAAPHGIKEKYDSFPNGGPEDAPLSDPIDLARQMAESGYSIFTLGCEPTLSKSTDYAVDFYKALSDMTLGFYCPLTDHKLLAACIIGVLLEKLDLRRLSEDNQAVIATLVHNGTPLEKVVEELHHHLSSQNQQVTTFQFGDPYNDSRDAGPNYKAFISSDTLEKAIPKLQEVTGSRLDPDRMRAVAKNKSTIRKQLAKNPFATVSIRFKNLGNDRITIEFFDKNLQKMCEDEILPDNFTMTKEFEIHVPINFILTCGPKKKTYNKTFTGDQDIDVNQIFNYAS